MTPDPAAELVVEVVASEQLAARTAGHIADQIRAALSDRGRATLAVSGGATPGPMLELLFADDLDWPSVTLLQVDERIAPRGHADRNLTDLESRREGTPATSAHLLAMPVDDLPEDDDAGDEEAGDEGAVAAADRYARRLRAVAGTPPVIDVVQLGLGDDGHTASLVPGDVVLDVHDRDVAVTRPYQGRRRMTLTYPCIDRARALVWMIAGAAKHAAFRGLVAGDPTLPAARVRRNARVVADHAAATRP